MKLRLIFFYFNSIFLFLMPVMGFANECRPAPPDIARLEKITESWFSVIGELAEFDPCNSSVSLNIPFGKKRPPLIIIAHGGAGLTRDSEMAAYYFRRLGMATLTFDSYKINNLGYLGVEFFDRKMNNESRQRMSYKVTQGAYEWAIKQASIDSTNIYFWGVSNGASVVANLAAVVDSTHVKGIFAEGLPPQGLGLPNKLNVPLFISYGEDDNYGTNIQLNQKQWTRTAICRENSHFGNIKDRNSLNCNALSNPNEPVETVYQWYLRLQSEGLPVNFKIYKNAAHSFFLNGPLNGTMVKNGRTRGSNSGASQAAREEFLNDIKSVLVKNQAIN